MKRHKKLITLLVALCFVFSLVPMAAASTPARPPAETAHVAWGDTQRLNALGIIEGYPDGTFGLGRDITRAEFAKVAVGLVGMAEGAEMLRPTPSQFRDVRTDVWYTGWINMASGLGLVQGDPGGTFRPNDRITNAEVITILLRALGYNDHLPGPWPVDYLAEAARQGINRGIAAPATAAALRGNVFMMASRTLDAEWVRYNRDTNTFDRNTAGPMVNNRATAQTLLAKNFEGDVVEDRIVLDWRKSGDRYEVQIVTGATATALTTEWLTLAKDATISGTDHVIGLDDRFVTYTTNEDGEITFIERMPYTRVDRIDADKDNSYLSQFEMLSATRIRMGDVSYTLASGAWISGRATVAGATYASLAANWFTQMGITAGEEVEAARIRLILNEDGQVAAILTANFDRPALIDSVIPARHRISVDAVAATVYRVGNDLMQPDTVRTIPANLGDRTFLIMRGTSEVGIADLKPGELLYYTPGAHGVDDFFTVVDRKVSGTLEVVQTEGANVFNVRVAGVNHTVAYHLAQVSTDNGDTFSDITNNLGLVHDLVGEQVTLYLDHSADVVYIVGDARGIGVVGNYGQVVKVNPTTGVRADLAGAIGVTGIASVELLLANGTTATYAVDDDSRFTDQDGVTRDGDTHPAFDNLDPGDFIEFRLRGDGRVDRMIEVTAAVSNLTTDLVDEDNNRILIGGNWFLAGTAVVFNVYGGEERIATFSMLEDALPVTNVVYVTSGNRVTHLAVSTELLGIPADYAVVMEIGRDRDGDFVRMMDNKGVVTRFDETLSTAVYGFKSVVHFRATGDDITQIHEVVNNVRAGNLIATVTAIDRANRSVRLDGGDTEAPHRINNAWFSVTDDTVMFDITGAPRVITLADLAVGDQILFEALVADPENHGLVHEGELNFLVVRN